MADQGVALKEWAAAIQALTEGTQLFILRKGGIREETKDFQVKSDSFFLYPTYEHQKKELLKEEYQSKIDETLKQWDPDSGFVAVSAFAELVEDIEISDQEQLEKLQNFHIWTERFAEERLRWKRKNPLHLMLLRMYKLEKPLQIKISTEYIGCKSWIELQDVRRDSIRAPVLSDEEFISRVSEIKAALR